MLDLPYTTRRNLAATAGQLAEHLPEFHDTLALFEQRELFDAFDGGYFQVSNEKTQACGGELTRLTDLTVREMGVYVARQRPPARARSRSLALLPAPLTTAVKSVKSVKPQDGGGWFSPPCRQTGCQFDGSASAEVVA